MLAWDIKKVLVVLGSVVLLCCFGAVFAATVSGVGIGTVADNVKGNLGGMAKLITAGAYIAGLGFGVGAIVKFKAHKDNPTQVALSVPIALLFVSAALLFLPSVFKSAGATMYTDGANTAGVSGITTIQ